MLAFTMFLSLLFFGWWLVELFSRRTLESSLVVARECLGEATALNDRLFAQIDERRQAEKKLKTQNLALAERVAAQSELLSKAAERDRSFEEWVKRCKSSESDVSKLLKQNAELCRRLEQSAEREQEAARRLGYLFPRGLETPPSVEDPLSPTWCKRERRFKLLDRVYMKLDGIWSPGNVVLLKDDGRYGVKLDSKRDTIYVPERFLKTFEEYDRAVEEESSDLAPDGRILTAAEVKAMGKDPAVQAAVDEIRGQVYRQAFNSTVESMKAENAQPR